DRITKIVNALVNEANTVQTRVPCGGVSVRTQLQTAVSQGAAASLEPRWFMDTISVDAKPATITAVAARDDVELVELQGSAPVSPMTAAAGTTEWNIDRVNAPVAWSAGYQGAGAIVGIIDSGANVQHQDLAPACVGGPHDGESCLGAGYTACTTSTPAGHCVG